MNKGNKKDTPTTIAQLVESSNQSGGEATYQNMKSGVRNNTGSPDREKHAGCRQ